MLPRRFEIATENLTDELHQAAYLNSLATLAQRVNESEGFGAKVALDLIAQVQSGVSARFQSPASDALSQVRDLIAETQNEGRRVTRASVRAHIEFLEELCAEEV